MAGRGIVQCAENAAVRLFKKLGQNPLVREGAALLGLYWLYSLIRWFVADHNPYEAFANAFKVIQLERQLGVFYEPTIQRGLIDHALGVVHFANWFYTVGYFPILILTAALLYKFNRERFSTFKLTFLLGLGLALVCFSLFPLAPPRMLPEAGFVDTQQLYGADLYNHKSVVSFYNPYAAMPSLHFGWALLVGMMAYSFNRRALKAIGVLYPCCMALVIVTTGHHYILDIAGGGIVVGLAYSLVKVLPWARSVPISTPTGIYAVNPFSTLPVKFLHIGRKNSPQSTQRAQRFFMIFSAVSAVSAVKFPAWFRLVRVREKDATTERNRPASFFARLSTGHTPRPPSDILCDALQTRGRFAI